MWAKNAAVARGRSLEEAGSLILETPSEIELTVFCMRDDLVWWMPTKHKHRHLNMFDLLVVRCASAMGLQSRNYKR
jgi:hypothetical protein